MKEDLLKKLLESVLGRSKSARGGDEAVFKCPSCNHHKNKLTLNLETQKFPIEGYKSQGKDVWMIDFISKKDYTLKGVKHFRYFFKKKGYQVAFWLRQRNKKLGFVKSARR